MVAKIVKVTENGKHTGEVSCLATDEEHVFSGGADALIKVSKEKRKKTDLCQLRNESRMRTKCELNEWIVAKWKTKF